jgi:glucosyl-3-phosphoglycerate synthase
MLPMEDRASAWFRQRSSHWRDWPADQLLSAKRRQGLRISVVIPARDEEQTVAGVVTAIRQALVLDAPLVDEIVVVDSDSTDATAAVAARAGATVHRARDIAPHLGSYPGKGEALWKSLLVTHGDLLVFVDADLTRWGPHFVTGLIGPLLDDPDLLLVKGFYARVKTEHDGSTSTEGGRVTELVARPLLSLWWPELTGVVQPLAGEWAARRSLMESLRIPVGYGVELASLLDTFTQYGLNALAQVDLGSRAHRHQSDHDLALMAAELLVVAENRHATPRHPRLDVALHQFVRERGPVPDSPVPDSPVPDSPVPDSPVRPRVRPVPAHERPPASTVLPSTVLPSRGAAAGPPAAEAL